MFDDEDGFIEDVDFSHVGVNVQSSPQRKLPKKHDLDFIHSFIEQSSEESLISSDKLGLQRQNNAASQSRNNNDESPRNLQVTKRKFPGPAGLLPERVKFQNTSLSDSNLTSNACANNSKDKHEIDDACSQYSSIFETIAWKCAMQDFKQLGLTGVQSCNVSHLKRSAFSNKSKAMKYPFLIAAVSNMDTGQELFVTLRDSTGDIQAYLDSEVLEQFPVELRRGCVILLKKVGVIKSGQARGLYLLITPNNLAVIYPPDSGISRLSILRDSCQDIDFTNLDVSLNASLDASFNISNPTSRHVGIPHNITVNLENKNTCNQSTPKLFPKANVPPRTSTSNIDHLKKTNLHHSVRQVPQQSLPGNHNVSSSCSSSTIPQARVNTSFQPKKSLENNLPHSVYNTSEKKLDRTISVSELSQNGINKGEDLSTTVNSLLEDLDTDSIFGDF